MTYYKKVRCENCGYSGELEIPQGLTVQEFPCPQCNTRSLTSTFKDSFVDRRGVLKNEEEEEEAEKQ